MARQLDIHQRHSTTAESYLSGFGNEHASEAVANALPAGQNSPQRAAYGLYAEQISGTAFTAPRASNRRAWLYRKQPSVRRGKPRQLERNAIRTAPTDDALTPGEQLRWDPWPIPTEPQDFIDGWLTLATNGACHLQLGMAVHLYLCNQPMRDRYFVNGDGELLLVAQQGRLQVRTEAGVLDIEPGEICVIPRGFKFTVDPLDGVARGYVCENYGALLELPELGPIGANCLANPRDFLYPVAQFDETDRPCELIFKTNGRLFAYPLQRSPLDVVAWHGNYVPYKYDLRHFNTIGSISFDHPDPSIFTVLTSQSSTAGVANIDFVVFPPRWLVAENTFRPPWFHSNVMSEFMGLIYGIYDAKPQGFVPGGASLHNCMIPHGPSSDAFEAASNTALEPVKLDQTMAFMFESRYPFLPTSAAMQSPTLQTDYTDCWRNLPTQFSPPTE